MPKQRTDPVTDEQDDERHPAFGLVSVHRINSTPGAVLFQSDLRHPTYVTIEVHEATRKRDLKHDWVHSGRRVCEISMSEAQFASFVASGGTEGVPCTIEYTAGGEFGTGERPGLNPAPRLQLSSDEMRAAANEAYAGIQEKFDAYSAALETSGPGTAAARRVALNNLKYAIQNAAPNVAYAAQQLEQHAEEVVEKSRADIEVMVQRMAEQHGLDAGGVMQAIEAGEPTDSEEIATYLCVNCFVQVVRTPAGWAVPVEIPNAGALYCDSERTIRHQPKE